MEPEGKLQTAERDSANIEQIQGGEGQDQNQDRRAIKLGRETNTNGDVTTQATRGWLIHGFTAGVGKAKKHKSTYVFFLSIYVFKYFICAPLEDIKGFFVFI